MPVTKDISKMDLKGYAVTYNGVTLGWTEDVDPSGLKLDKVEKKVGELANITLDRLFVGMSGTVKVTLHQVNIDTFRAAIPGAPATGPIPLTPPLYASDYVAAKALSIHPRGNADATEDINLLKCAVDYKLPKSSDGKTWRKLDLEFTAFPDQAQLIAEPSVLTYGYVGTPPT